MLNRAKRYDVCQDLLKGCKVHKLGGDQVKVPLQFLISTQNLTCAGEDLKAKLSYLVDFIDHLGKDQEKESLKHSDTCVK
eukprot:6143260-Ditylum_brightwellii.AAC.1